MFLHGTIQRRIFNLQIAFVVNKVSKADTLSFMSEFLLDLSGLFLIVYDALNAGMIAESPLLLIKCICRPICRETDWPVSLSVSDN